MKYEEITDDMRHQLVKTRLRRYEMQHYEATLNLEAAQAAGRNDDAQRMEQQLLEFEAAIRQTKATLAEFPKPDEPPPDPGD